GAHGYDRFCIFRQNPIAEWGDIESWTPHQRRNKRARQDFPSPEVAANHYVTTLNKVLDHPDANNSQKRKACELWERWTS
ncbi:hypothetical protein BGX23_000174, partial [Mortierella sp. AD031]